MLLESSRLLAPLAEEGLLLDLTERVSPDFLQQFLPEAVENMRYDGRLYGIPESLNVLALFYNPTLVADPPIDVQQLMQRPRCRHPPRPPRGFLRGLLGHGSVRRLRVRQLHKPHRRDSGLDQLAGHLAADSRTRPGSISISMPRRPRMRSPLKKRPTLSAVRGRCRACVRSWAMTASMLCRCPMARSCRAAQCSGCRGQ